MELASVSQERTLSLKLCQGAPELHMIAEGALEGGWVMGLITDLLLGAGRGGRGESLWQDPERYISLPGSALSVSAPVHHAVSSSLRQALCHTVLPWGHLSMDGNLCKV